MMRVALFAAAGALTLPTSAHAAVTIGSDLARTPTESDGCVSQPSCTFLQNALPGNALALTAPADGVIVRWRVKTAAGPSGSVRLHVLRPDASGKYASGATSTSQSTLAAGGTQAFDTRIAIGAGDAIGLDQNAAAPVLALDAPGATGSFWEPRLATPALPTYADDDIEQLFNADIEPDADGDLYGDETQDACPQDPSTHGACPADLAVTNVMAPERIDPGGDAVETVEISNLGRFAATGVRLNWQLYLAPGMTETVLSGPCRPPNGNCEIGTIAVGGKVTLAVATHVPRPTFSAFEWVVNSSAETLSADPVPSNNRAEARLTINAIDVPLPQPQPVPSVDRRAPRLSLSVTHQKLGDVLAKGLRVVAGCDEACRGNLHLALGTRAAGDATFQTPKTATLRVKLSARVRKALRRSRRATLTITVTVTDLAGNASGPVRETVVLKRR